VIVVTTLNGRPAAVNAELVERIHENPDTTLVLVDGKRLVVRESMAEVIGLIDQAKARVLRLAAARPQDAAVHCPEGAEATGPTPENPDPQKPDLEKIGR